ncbi:OmpA family protein [Pontibacter pamirensis]|uniref:OmpA family protein n=1 Tax=Pontibacter pamirensis TaxID=2562824 RepID=UPI0013895C8C|nr:OmpA family protein [Pontibacter pamirensis]
MKTNFTITFLAAAGLLASCNEVREDNVDGAGEVREIATEDTAVMYDDGNLAGGVLETEEEAFKEVDFGAPAVVEPALQAAEIEVRGAEGYRIYSVGEDIMFDLDEAEIRPSGEEKLQEIARTLKENNTEGMIRVYGFTDSLAGEAYNRQLARERARAVEDWLRRNSGLDTARMRLVPVGEHMYEATNETARGRQQNRRVEIVVVEQLPL